MAGVIITPVCRASFPTLLKAKAVEEGGKEKFSIVLVFSEDVDKSWIKAAIKEAGEEKWGDKFLEYYKSPKFRRPVKEADDDEKRRYEAGAWYLNAYSDVKPGCVFKYADPETGKAKRMTDAEIAEMIYPGALVRASIRLFGYENKGKGIGVAVNNIQLIDSTTPRLDSRVKAEDEFEADEMDTADLPDTPSADDEDEPSVSKASGKARQRTRTRDVQDLL